MGRPIAVLKTLTSPASYSNGVEPFLWVLQSLIHKITKNILNNMLSKCKITMPGKHKSLKAYCYRYRYTEGEVSQQSWKKTEMLILMSNLIFFPVGFRST